MTRVIASDSSQASDPPTSSTDSTMSTNVALSESARNRSIDVVRFFAAVGIVFVHAAKHEPLLSMAHAFRFAVPFYLFASLYFQSLSLRRNPDRPLLQCVAARVRRLYLPFLAWSLIYLVARDAKHVLTKSGESVHLEIGLLWKGDHYHLWFLPFLLAFSTVLLLVHWGLLRHSRRWRWPLIVVAVAAGFAFALIPMPSWNEDFPSPTYAYVQYWRALTSVCWALAFAWFMTAGPTVYSVSQALGMAGIVLAVIVSVQQVVRGKILLIPRGLSGLGMMLVALAPWRPSQTSFLARWGQHSYGVYLCHVLVIEFVRVATSRAHLPEGIGLDLFIFVLGLVGSIALVLLLARSRLTAWLNG